MSADLFLALLAFAFVSSVTPGPNNMMLMASGVNFGFARTIPHMVGISVGFLVLLLAVGFGLGAVLAAFPAVETALKWASAVYLVRLAWKIATSRAVGDGAGGEDGSTGRPMTVLEAALFQWVNPKAWAMALVGMGAYTSAERPVASVLVVGVVFALVNFPSVSIWAGFGVALRGFLSKPARLKWFNIGMGVLLVSSVVPILF